jgi:polyribonucleotide nucleotidyltransferase
MNKFKIEIGDRNLEVETGGLAERSSGNVLIKYGDTSIFSVAQLGEEREGLDFFPLTCRYEERYYAAGRIRGSRFLKREGRPSDNSVLISRMIDRTIRPRFSKDIHREIQIVDTCLSYDKENDPAVLGIIGTSLSLLISEIPWQGPVSAVRIGEKDNEFILNPTTEQREQSKIDLLLSAIKKDGDILINMIEARGDEIDEDLVCKAFDFAKPELKKIIDFQKEIAQKIGKEKIVFPVAEHDTDIEKQVGSFLAGDKLEKAIYQKDSRKRQKDITNLKESLIEMIEEKYVEDREDKIKHAFYFFDKKYGGILKENILKNNKRPDGRKIDEVREIETRVNVLPRVHGSAFFSRGLTKVLSVTTLGAPGDKQILDEMELTGKKRFIHYYNFPPYCSGETKPMRGPGRREIGHGALAEKAIMPLLPNIDEFPYTILTVSEILCSNGSSSMASVSGVSLSLMDAGVPIKNPAAGIAMGIIQGENGEYKLLTDIQGEEDGHGGMDFKVAGTKHGITAIQLDVKIDGINGKMLKEILERAKKARLEILEKTNKTLPASRKELSELAPRIYTLKINPDKIGSVIGPGGKMINEIIDTCGVDVDIEDSGEVFITRKEGGDAEKAVKWVEDITREAKVGETYQAKVKKIMDFGAFVEILPGQEGLVHISKFTSDRVEKVTDLVKVGDVIPVKVIGIDNTGKIDLSAKEAGFKPNFKR